MTAQEYADKIKLDMNVTGVVVITFKSDGSYDVGDNIDGGYVPGVAGVVATTGVYLAQKLLS